CVASSKPATATPSRRNERHTNSNWPSYTCSKVGGGSHGTTGAKGALGVIIVALFPVVARFVEQTTDAPQLQQTPSEAGQNVNSRAAPARPAIRLGLATRPSTPSDVSNTKLSRQRGANASRRTNTCSRSATAANALKL